jgi:hypothetical protein
LAVNFRKAAGTAAPDATTCVDAVTGRTGQVTNLERLNITVVGSLLRNLKRSQPTCLGTLQELLARHRLHWLGGRLNVEWVIAEVRVIAEEAAQFPPPDQPETYPSK